MSTERMAPEPYGSLIDETTDRDREWFEQHPGKEQRIRKYVPGELWPLRYPSGCHVLVTQLAPGARTRVTTTSPCGAYNADEVALIEEHAAPVPAGLAERTHIAYIGPDGEPL